MSDTPPPAPPGPPSRPSSVPIPADRARIDAAPAKRVDVLPILYLVGFVVLAGALAYLWRHPTAPRGEAQQEARVDTLQQQLDARQKEVDTLAGRVAALEARPLAAPPDLGPLDARITALERKPPPAPVDLKPLGDRIAALEAKPPVDLKPVQDRIGALEAKPPVDLKPLGDRVAALEAKPPVDLGPLSNRLAALERKEGADTAAQAGAVQQLAAQLGAQIGALPPRLDALDARVGAAEGQAKQSAAQTAAALTAINERAQRLGRAQAVAVALTAGQPLGDLPGAPPALARFAHQAPPTESGLRLSFDAAAAAAQRASEAPITDNQSLGERMWTRAQQSLTVRQGDRVLVGDPIAGVIQHARQLLDAGDLTGAVRTLGTLPGPPRAAMADWIGQAQSLLDARAAVSSLAAAQG